VLDPVEVALEAETERVGLLGLGPVAGADGARGPRSQGDIERRLALVAADQRAPDEGVRALVGVPNRSIGAAQFVEIIEVDRQK
jgi:hypothetical protein